MSTIEDSVRVMSDKQVVSLFNELNSKATLTEPEVYRYEIYSKEIETRFDTRFKRAVVNSEYDKLIYNRLDTLWEAAYIDKDHLWELFLEAMAGSNTIKSIVNTSVQITENASDYCTCGCKLQWMSLQLMCPGCKKVYAG